MAGNQNSTETFIVHISDIYSQRWRVRERGESEQIHRKGTELDIVTSCNVHFIGAKGKSRDLLVLCLFASYYHLLQVWFNLQILLQTSVLFFIMQTLLSQVLSLCVWEISTFCAQACKHAHTHLICYAECWVVWWEVRVCDTSAAVSKSS